MSHQESPTENKRNSENEMLAKGVVVWVPIIVTVVLYVMFKNDGFNGYAVVGFSYMKQHRLDFLNSKFNA